MSFSWPLRLHLPGLRNGRLAGCSCHWRNGLVAFSRFPWSFSICLFVFLQCRRINSIETIISFCRLHVHTSLFFLFFLGTCRVCLSGTGREAYIDLRPYGLMARSDSSVWASQIGRLAIGHTHTWQMGSVLRFAVTHKFDWTGGSSWLWKFVWKRND